MIFSVVGAGYVGLSLSILISKKYKVNLIDIDQRKIDCINNKISPIKDADIEKNLKSKKIKLNATLDYKKSYSESDYVIIATPTNYDESGGSFDTSTVEKVIKNIKKFNSKTQIVIKSTIPIGFTEKIKKKNKIENIFYSPEFLREGKALYDNMHPSRIVVGEDSNEAKKFANILLECSKNNKLKKIIHYMESSEAEAVKLFSNTYLAMRISFFNEMDTFAEINRLSTEKIINGVCSDPRIGDYYNNPSFGYGGYCLPKDTKQLYSNFNNVPNSLMKAIIDSNQVRKDFIIKSVMEKKPKTLGIYRLAMKKDSDNFRQSAMFTIINEIKKYKIKIKIYEPELIETIDGTEHIKNIKEFIRSSDLILANRYSKDLDSVLHKIYTRDIFNEN